MLVVLKLFEGKVYLVSGCRSKGEVVFVLGESVLVVVGGE